MNFFSKNKDFIPQESPISRKTLKRYIEFILGCFIISITYNVFIASNNLVPGGVGGIAIIINKLFGVENFIIILILNILLLFLSYILLEKDKTKSTIFGAILFPLFVELTKHINIWLQFETSNRLLSVLVGGILYGLGIGLVFKAGFTTGGTDIVNQILAKYGKMSLGKAMLISDGLIVLSSGIFLGIDSMMYSILILYLISTISDRVVLGISNNKMFYIITEKDIEISEYIMSQLGYGVTIFKAVGGYHKHKGNVLMTVLPTRDYFLLKNGIKEIDRNSFFIVTDAYEVFGGEVNG